MRLLVALWRLCATADDKCKYCGRLLTPQELTLPYLLVVCVDCFKKYLTH